jgi:hypothetical protein
VRAAFLLGLLSACGFSLTSAPGIGEDGGPSDGPIDAAEIDAIDGSPDVDTDGDGLNDAVDNCASVSNLDQRNWDLDARGDACDPCPHLPSADADGDGDGVGDACDPRPTIAGDSRALWLGFSTSADLTGWTDGNTGGTGAWAVTGGALVQSIADPSQFASLATPVSYQRIYVATSIEVVSLAANATLGVCTGWNGNSFDCCNVNTTNGAAVAEAQTGTAIKSNLPWPAAVAAGARIDIVQNMLTANTCRFGTAVTVQTTPTAISGKVLFFVGHAAAKYRYLFVVQIGT